ncbi:hypothetical protein BD289DRAFT_187888 [Coniella lustricola]|uniref:Uncharacterized protein n=1 Tax=Coniella lustricola TaxID=2025994 RepID=A0A2T2ZSZ6_9PEZI|nr:hypothetical protein BD289DRAFT_187888 [Coniella lustricola]
MINHTWISARKPSCQDFSNFRDSPRQTANVRIWNQPAGDYFEQVPAQTLSDSDTTSTQVPRYFLLAKRTPGSPILELKDSLLNRHMLSGLWLLTDLGTSSNAVQAHPDVHKNKIVSTTSKFVASCLRVFASSCLHHRLLLSAFPSLPSADAVPRDSAVIDSRPGIQSRPSYASIRSDRPRARFRLAPLPLPLVNSRCRLPCVAPAPQLPSWLLTMPTP